jgi:predicted thioesterase
MLELPIGTTATAQLTVGKLDLASAISPDGRDAFPDVLATARLVALMEIAAGRVLAPLLGVGELSVGVSVDIVHTAATPPGATVVAGARFTGREGKHFVFAVEARDDGGEIGHGTHRRAIIDGKRLIDGALRRNQKDAASTRQGATANKMSE